MNEENFSGTQSQSSPVLRFTISMLAITIMMIFGYFLTVALILLTAFGSMLTLLFLIIDFIAIYYFYSYIFSSFKKRYSGTRQGDSMLKTLQYYTISSFFIFIFLLVIFWDVLDYIIPH